MSPKNGDRADHSFDSYPSFTLGTVSVDTGSLLLPRHTAELGRLGKYRLEGELGRGGMGVVYLAFDERLERQVALKVMRQAVAVDATAKDRFLREARAAARINSDHVVGIYEADEIGGIPYIALQLLHGCLLSEQLKEGDLPLPQAVRIAHQTALGLVAAHQLGLVHRDIKPGNIWLEAPDGRVKILDFGLAKPAAGHDEDELSGRGAVTGTPSYMAPEQATGQPLDGRADLFSLGVVLYRLVCGKMPFDGPTVGALLTAVVTDEPRPVIEINPQVPPALARLIHRMLAKNPDHRPASAGEVADQLVRAIPAATLTNRNRVNRWRWSAALAATGALTVVGFAIISLTYKDGRAIEIKVPDGKKVEAVGELVKLVPGSPNGQADADRRAAEWVLGGGGHVVLIRGESRQQDFFEKGAKLPPEPFKLCGVWIQNWAVPPTDADADRLEALTQLRRLAFNGEQTDTAVVKLSGFPLAKTVSELAIFSEWLTDDALAAVAKFTTLCDLHIGGSVELTGDGLDQLKGPKLRRLTFSRCRLTDEYLAHIAGMPNLEFLNVEQTSVTDAGLKTIGELPHLQQLGCYGVKGVTDAGLGHLKGARALSIIDLRGTSVTEGGVKQLAATLPKCTIEYDGGVIEPKAPSR